MTEAVTTQPGAGPRKRPYREYVDLAFAILFLPLLAYLGRNEVVRPFGELALFVTGVPIFLCGIRAWNRLRNPDRVPARWPRDDYPAGQRIEQLSLLLTLFTIAVISAGIFFDDKKHHVFHYLWYICAGWNLFLTRYIHDHKYIPPPSPPYDPSKATRPKPFQSDHWGRRNVSDSDPNAVP
jgi:hypothetical protein